MGADITSSSEEEGEDYEKQELERTKRGRGTHKWKPGLLPAAGDPIRITRKGEETEQRVTPHKARGDSEHRERREKKISDREEEMVDILKQQNEEIEELWTHIDDIKDDVKASRRQGVYTL